MAEKNIHFFSLSPQLSLSSIGMLYEDPNSFTGYFRQLLSSTKPLFQPSRMGLYFRQDDIYDMYQNASLKIKRNSVTKQTFSRLVQSALDLCSLKGSADEVFTILITILAIEKPPTKRTQRYEQKECIFRYTEEQMSFFYSS